MRIRIIVVLAFIIIGMVVIGHIPAQAQGQDDDWDLQELLEVGAQDINDYWQQVFADNNLQYTQPEIVLFTRNRIQTGCGPARSRTGPFYCPNDHTIYLPYNFMQNFLDNVGDFAVVLILAHEWGHSVQAQVGELRGLSINRELQADCYAGSWARHAATTSEMVELSPGDLDEGATMLFLVGDRTNDWFAENAHGTSDQRIDAYNIGLEQDYPGCEVNQ